MYIISYIYEFVNTFYSFSRTFLVPGEGIEPSTSASCIVPLCISVSTSLPSHFAIFQRVDHPRLLWRVDLRFPTRRRSTFELARYDVNLVFQKRQLISFLILVSHRCGELPRQLPKIR